MRTCALLQVAVESPPGQERKIGAILQARFNAAPVEYHDLELGRTTVSVYVPKAGFHVAKARRSLAGQLTALTPATGRQPSLRIRIRTLKPQDWAESWKRHFHPIVVGDRLLIKPSWSRRQPRPGAVAITLDPGLSFGTGQHPTTRFCLEQLVKLGGPGSPPGLLDIGTGSGILAIAAAELGWSPVVAIDFDADAVRIARENARRNRAQAIEFRRADLLAFPERSRRKFGVICANLTSDLLTAGATRILGRLAAGGTLLLAGILNQQFVEVRLVYEALGLRLQRKRTVGEWTSGAFAGFPV
jgi:ribosomal protein L11 methyltransferase